MQKSCKFLNIIHKSIWLIESVKTTSIEDEKIKNI